MIEQLLAYLTPYLTIFGIEPWKQAFAVVIAFFMAAWVVGFVISRLIGLFATGTKNIIDEQLLKHLHRPLIWTMMIIGLIYAAQVLGIKASMMNLLESLAISIIIVVWMIFALRVTKLVLIAMVARSHEHSFIRLETLPLFNNLFAILIFFIAVYLFFQAWGVNMTAWLASAGVIGIAVGFAAKDTLANLFSGVFIMADSPYKIGDYVVLDEGSRGKITHIGIRSTRMLTRDDVEITIPNSIMGNSKIINESGGPHLKFRMRLKIAVAYGSDIDEVERILLEQAEYESLICTYPVPRVRFRNFGDSGLEYELLFWIDEPELRGRALHHINTKIYKAFVQQKIEIPFNQQDIYIKEMPFINTEAN